MELSYKPFASFSEDVGYLGDNTKTYFFAIDGNELEISDMYQDLESVGCGNKLIFQTPIPEYEVDIVSNYLWISYRKIDVDLKLKWTNNINLLVREEILKYVNNSILDNHGICLSNAHLSKFQANEIGFKIKKIREQTLWLSDLFEPSQIKPKSYLILAYKYTVCCIAELQR